ncbi:unnamed protein product [Schistosoma margrebowiei]|uniref:Uncharacterized protein n=1 Tax=Schistosoma margrebowiei TaxID=48269 RepID=A0A3P7XU11_9TREM|nr:unnamed protein product [Schistosoma margrebowiei]
MMSHLLIPVFGSSTNNISFFDGLNRIADFILGHEVASNAGPRIMSDRQTG